MSGEEAEDAYRVWLGEGAYLMEGAVEILDYLKERYPLYVVTNGVGATQRKRLKASGLDKYFRDIFISEEAGSQKPQKEFFEYCFAHIKEAGPEEMMVIGDSLTSDIQGGVNAGIDTCWFNPQGKENRKRISVAREIRRLSELKAFL
jgi:2-haloacid dehalogenase